MATRRGLPAQRAPGGDIDVDDELQQLLKEQEDFMRQRARPAAKITRVGGAATASSPATPAASAATPATGESETPDDGPQVVGMVRERDVVSLDGVLPRATSGGFPAVKRRGESLFGRRARQNAPPATTDAAAAKLSGNGKIVERAPGVVAAAAAGKPQAAPRSDVVSAAEWDEIDATNAAALRSMSAADIRAAQEELYRSLDPALLEKLKGRRQAPAAKPTTAKPKPKPTVEPQSTEEPTRREDVVAATKRLKAAGFDLSKIETEEQLFAEAAKLPAEERAKHAWMQPVEPETPEATRDTKKTKTSRLPVRANAPKRPDSKASGERFDFNGDVVVTAHPSHSGLYHHGDDPDAAGYTMDELLHLARSTVASQRAVALLTVSKILRKRQTLETGRAPEVLPAELPVALRMALDDQNYTALSAAIAALHAFLCCESIGDNDAAFETSRGSIVASPRIHLHVDVGTTEDELLREVVYIDTNESEEDGSKIGDQELCALDPVQGFLKMTIVTRLSYIVTTIQLPDEDAMDKLLDILLHIAAHSPRAAQAVAADRSLMKALQTKYLENERVLTLQTEPADEFEQAAARTRKTLRLVRVLCQGSRAVATLFVESGVIQTTKGFLALRADQIAGPSSHPLEDIQLESLRVWRVLLGYGLDFHCFSYLYPLLCGFDAVNLVRDKSDEASGVKRWSDRCLAAIFAALDTFAQLDTIHEAQHYFNQFGFFVQLASDEIARRVPQLNPLESNPVPAVALRFLSSCSALVNKFHLNKSLFHATFKLLRNQLGSPAWCAQLLQASDSAELLVAITTFGAQVLNSDLVGDDEDEEEVRKQFFLKWKPLASSLITACDRSKDSLRICELLLATTDTFLRTDHQDDEFIRSIYGAALKIVQDLKPGHQYWIHSLFTQVLFNPTLLQKAGFFPDLNDATAMGRVLTPIYQALVNSTKDQEAHSQLLFATRMSPKQKQTCHLVDPQDEHEYVGSNLPLPFFWMFCPFSRLEYSSQANATGDSQKQKHAATSLGPSHAEAEEMKVIVSAACRYIDQLESIVGAVRSSSVDGADAFGDEDRLFHLMHVFFAGTDVLFDEYVDLALSKLLKKYALSVIHSAQPKALYDGMLRNLRQFESIEAGEKRDSSKNDGSDAPKSFTTETQTVLTFVERLVNEFTSSSFGNTHFARLVTLFLMHDFPLEIRKWVWKELAGSHLLHRLEPFGGTDARGTTGLRATRDAKHSDEILVRAMTQAIATRQSGVVSHERGPFAYWLAIHHTVAYVFGAGDSDSSAAELSFSRQKLLQDLVTNASPLVWRHLLSHDITAFSPAAHAEIKQTRVDRILQHAAFSDAQAATFRLVLEAAAQTP